MRKFGSPNIDHGFVHKQVRMGSGYESQGKYEVWMKLNKERYNQYCVGTSHSATGAIESALKYVSPHRPLDSAPPSHSWRQTYKNAAPQRSRHRWDWIHDGLMGFDQIHREIVECHSFNFVFVSVSLDRSSPTRIRLSGSVFLCS
jgi:hypothetical protein